MPIYPNVPFAPGVPPVPRNPNAIPEIDPGVDEIGANEVNSDPDETQWGLQLDGEFVIEADNVVSFEYKRDWVIADYQIEKGGYESYDKVQLPFDARVRFSCGGSVDSREAFLKSVKAIENDLKLYDIITPEEVYPSVNVGHVDFRRTAEQGVGLIVVDMYLIEIRDTATQTFANAQASPASPTATKSPSAAAKKNNGTVQPVPKATSDRDQKDIDLALGQALAG